LLQTETKNSTRFLAAGEVIPFSCMYSLYVISPPDYAKTANRFSNEENARCANDATKYRKDFKLKLIHFVCFCMSEIITPQR
jgi:hypothetical protein